MNARSGSLNVICAALIATGMVGCGEEPQEPSSATTITSALNDDHGCPSGYPFSVTALPFDQFTSRCSTSGDWDHTGIISPRVFATNDTSWYFGAECGLASNNHHYVVGVSARTDASRAHSVKCATNLHNVGTPTSRHYLSRANSQLQPINDPTSNQTGGWVWWNSSTEVKAECLFHEIVTGVAQLESGEIDAISCNLTSGATGVTTGPSQSSCQRLSFDQQGDHCNQSCNGGSDWAFGYFKNTCGTNQYLKGISKKKSTGEIAALLCCNF
jgi:hypothetical protein